MGRISALFLAAVIVSTIAVRASANGRPPSTSSIHFSQASDQDIIAGLTFGLVVSHDGGTTWQWMCEKAVGYSGMYDPIYAYSQSGAVFATTFDGLKVMRDGCTFNATPPGTTFVSTNQLGPDHAFYYAAADPNDAKVYKSTDDGMTFPQSASPGQLNDWWQSIVVAPSDATRVYLSGYRLGNNTKPFLLFESTDGGQSFTALTQTGLTTSMNSTISFVGVSPSDANVLYAEVTLEDGVSSNGLYEIDVANDTSWTHMLSKLDLLSFVARANGDLVAATPSLGAFKSSDGGTSWTTLTGAPHINCLAENAAGEVWACTQNYGSPGVQSDGFGIMKSTDLTTWTGVLKYQDITGPVTCAAGTAQQDMCTAQIWCGLRQQLGITANPTSCAASAPDGSPDAGSGSGSGGKSKGCCDTGSGGGLPALLLAGLVVGALLLRRRRPRLG